MAMAMATLASFFIDTGDIDSTMKTIKQTITKKEVDMLTEFGGYFATTLLCSTSQFKLIV
jgi:hypothetical protein